MAANERKIDKCVCPSCLKNEMERGLMCASCYKWHEDGSKENIKYHKKVESQVEFVIRRTEENLVELKRELDSKMGETGIFFSQAHNEVASECRKANLSFNNNDPAEKKEFMDLVRVRYTEIMEKAGQEELYQRVERLKEVVRSSDFKMQWYKKLQLRERDADVDIDEEVQVA